MNQAKSEKELSIRGITPKIIVIPSGSASMDLDKLEESKAIKIESNIPNSKSSINLSPTNRKIEINSSCEDSKPTASTVSSGRSKWNKLSHVIFTVNTLRKERVERIMSESHLEKTIAGPKTLEKKRSLSDPNIFDYKNTNNNALREFGERSAYFQALERGSDQDYKLILEFIDKDPKRFLYDADDPERLCNKPNTSGQIPLYVACKNGHLKIVQLLLEQKANPFQMSQVEPKLEESILAVAARWSHLSIIEFLLTKIEWPNKHLKQAISYSQNEHITDLLKRKVKKTNKAFCWGICGKSRPYLRDKDNARLKKIT